MFKAGHLSWNFKPIAGHNEYEFHEWSAVLDLVKKGTPEFCDWIFILAARVGISIFPRVHILAPRYKF